jgi:hypothetical protein
MTRLCVAVCASRSPRGTFDNPTINVTRAPRDAVWRDFDWRWKRATAAEGPDGRAREGHAGADFEPTEKP